MTNNSRLDTALGMGDRITRRDFVNGVLVAGAATQLPGCGRTASKAEEPFAPSGSAWTGYGGVGDYAWSNGNTQAVMDAAHGIRDRLYPAADQPPIDENFDLIVVGGGFSGMTAAYEFSKRAAAGRHCLLLENHPIVGGEAKQNMFEIDGRQLVAPQGSNGGLLFKPGYVRGSYGKGLYEVYTDYSRELGIASHYDLEPLAGGAERYEIPNYHFAPMAPGSESGYETGYHFRDRGWVRNPARDGFTHTPWPIDVQKQMDDYVHNRRDVLSDRKDAEAWLDSITYYDLLDKLGYGEQVRRYVDPYLAVANFGVCGNAISAYAAHRLGLPGTTLPKPGENSGAAHIGVISFPGGNAAILRMMLARMIPGSIGGDGSTATIHSAPIDFGTLDRPGAPVRIRCGATVIDVRHEGTPSAADHVLVSYVQRGKIRKARARAVVMASGGWVNRNIATDLGEAHASAYGEFHYGPVLTANVALRHWRFFDRLGIMAARWFEGLGWHVGVRRNVAFGSPGPLTPDDPLVLTFYIPFLKPDLPAAAQGPAARMAMLEASYTDLERQIRVQMSEMFGAAGFDARRDIAGIVLNRWGHAFCAPQPGFFLGRDGNEPPSDVLRRPHGRIVFAHSELQGLMSMAYGMTEAHRGAGQALEMI